MTGKHTVIEPVKGFRLPDFVELWQYRELLLTLVSRDIRVRYKQTAVGVAWILIQPLITMIIFTVIFGHLGKLPSDGKPYALFTLVALLPWQLFAKSLTQGSGSLVAMQGVLTKVYFPRIFAPLAEVLSGLVDFAISLTLLLVVLVWFRHVPGWQIIALPLFVLFAVVAALAVSLWLAAINVEYRDVQFALPFLVQLWMWITPVVYPVSMIPEQWRWLIMLNPMAGVVEGFRWAVLGTEAPDPFLLSLSLATTVVILIFGLIYFDRCQRTLADRV